MEKVPENEYDLVQQDPLIQELINELATVAQSEEEIIDLLDSATWGEHDFSRAKALVWNAIAPRAAHQQRVENLVQTAAHLGLLAQRFIAFFTLISRRGRAPFFVSVKRRRWRRWMQRNKRQNRKRRHNKNVSSESRSRGRRGWSCSLSG